MDRDSAVSTCYSDSRTKLLGTYKEKERDTLTVLVMGKGGAGKSSTVNSIFWERVVAVSAFQLDVPRPVMVPRERSRFTLNIIDTPAVVEGGYVNDQALELIKRGIRFLSAWLRTAAGVIKTRVKILPNGTAWIPSIVQTKAVAANDSPSIVVDQKLIDGPNANGGGKMFIPLIIAFQYFFVVKRVQNWIKDDIAKAPKSSWE